MKERIAIVGGMVITGDDPAGAAERLDLLIDDGIIVDIDSAVSTVGADVVDAEEHTLVPGFVDAHVHITLAGPAPTFNATAALTMRAAANLRAMLRDGVTAARDVGGYDGIGVAVREAQRKGWIDGPTLFVANQFIAATGGHAAPGWDECGCIGADRAYAADGPDEMRRAVRYQASAGADHIKVALNHGRNRVDMTEPELAALVDEAHRLGKRVACHASIPDAIDMAVACGVDTVEHGNGATPEALAGMAAAGTILVPTAWAFRDGLQKATERLLNAVGDEEAERIQAVWQGRVDHHYDTVREARAAGVTIAAGSDVSAGEPVAPVHSEAAVLVDLGLTPGEAVIAATVNGARTIGDDHLGRLRIGGRADAVLVRGRPDLDVSALADRALVLQAGRSVNEQDRHHHHHHDHDHDHEHQHGE